MSKHVSAVWSAELAFDAIDDDGAAVSMGRSPDGFGPAALVLAALAGCTGMDVATIMGKKKVAFDTYRVEVNGQQRADFPRLYTSISVEHLVSGRSIDDRAVVRAIELSARKYCPVGATLASGATLVEHRMGITDEHGKRSSVVLAVGPHGKGLSLSDDI